MKIENNQWTGIPIRKNKLIKIFRITTVPQSLFILLMGQLKHVNKYFEVVGISSPGVDLNELHKREHIRVFPNKMTRKISPLQDIISVIRLINLIRVEKPMIIHTHTPKAGTLGMIAAWACSVPIRIHTVAGLPLLEEKRVKREVLGVVEKITYFFATKIYPNSNGLEKIILQNKYCKKEKLKVLANGSSNGINTEYFSRAALVKSRVKKIVDKLYLSQNGFIFIYVGRIVKDKGINELVEAFRKLLSKYPNIKLLLVGPYENQLDPVTEQTSNFIKHCNNIIETGFQDDVRPYLTISDALVFPSYREGFPNVVMQAGAMGLPSIVTEINGCNEIIQDGVNGVIIPPKDIEALTNAMEGFITNTAKVDRLAGNARQMIVDRYEQKYVWEAIKEEYDRLLKEKGLAK